MSQIEKTEELERLTTFTIIDVSDFEVVDTENATTDGDQVTTRDNDYWDLLEITTAPTVASVSDTNEYWDVSDTNEYWGLPLIEPTMMPTTMQSTVAPTTPAKEPDFVVTANENERVNGTGTASFYNTLGSADGPTYFTYIIIGSQADPVGFGDLHDPSFDKWVRQGNFTQTNLEDGTVGGIPLDQRCSYQLYVYPTQSFYDSFITTTPVRITMGIMAVFIFAIVLFGVYNRLVEKRQKLILHKATQSTALVASLFPKVSSPSHGRHDANCISC